MSQARKTRAQSAQQAAEIKRLKLSCMKSAGEILGIIAPHMPPDLILAAVNTVRDAEELIRSS